VAAVEIGTGLDVLYVEVELRSAVHQTVIASAAVGESDAAIGTQESIDGRRPWSAQQHGRSSAPWTGIEQITTGRQIALRAA
jgi:hypothetical protein